MSQHVIVLDVVGLHPAHITSGHMPNLAGLAAAGSTSRLRPCFPAVTLPVQASFSTGRPPAEHGIVANGFFDRAQYQVRFWEQAASLVQAPRFWDEHPEISTALLFMQLSLYANCDTIITPKPIHSDGGLTQWCYSKPVGFYEELAAELGPFNLMHYWGPMAGIGSSRWIATAAVATLARRKPRLMFVYLPHLDYNMQRLGPDHPQITGDLALVDAEIGRIVDGVEQQGLREKTTFVVLSEYMFHPVTGDVAINRVLRDAGLLAVRTIDGRDYVDLEMSRAFAMVDHQVAHIYCQGGAEKEAAALLADTDGVDLVLDDDGKGAYQVDHPRTGELVAIAKQDRWFSYPWWQEEEREPVYAPFVDIHAKPGYDPLELFFDPKRKRVPSDTRLIRGSHGRPATSDADLVPLVISAADPVEPTAEVTEITEIPALLTTLLAR